MHLEKNPDKLFTLLKELSSTLFQKNTNFFKFVEGICNAMIYPYSNARIEVKNTHIKTIKHSS